MRPGCEGSDFRKTRTGFSASTCNFLQKNSPAEKSPLVFLLISGNLLQLFSSSLDCDYLGLGSWLFTVQAFLHVASLIHPDPQAVLGTMKLRWGSCLDSSSSNSLFRGFTARTMRVPDWSDLCGHVWSFVSSALQNSWPGCGVEGLVVLHWNHPDFMAFVCASTDPVIQSNQRHHLDMFFSDHRCNMFHFCMDIRLRLFSSHYMVPRSLGQRTIYIYIEFQ